MNILHFCQQVKTYWEDNDEDKQTNIKMGRLDRIEQAKRYLQKVIDFNNPPIVLQNVQVIVIFAADEILEVFGRDAFEQCAELLGFNHDLADYEAEENLNLFRQVLDVGMERGGDDKRPLLHPPRSFILRWR